MPLVPYLTAVVCLLIGFCIASALCAAGDEDARTRRAFPLAVGEDGHIHGAGE